MLKVDLSLEATAEADRLSKARALTAGGTASLVTDPLIYVARRNAVRRSLAGRVLLLWRLSYQDAVGHTVESALVALTIDRRGARIDARRADWSVGSLPAFVSHQAAAWRDAVEENVRRFTATRLARERAIAAAGPASTHPFQVGLFDRRTQRARIAVATAGADLAEKIAVRAKIAASAGAISSQPPQLLLVLIPRDAARV